MEGKNRLTKETVAQEARFILDSLIAAGQYSKEVPFEELRRLCEQSVSLRLLDYINFLERFGYITYDRNTHLVTITTDGERVVGGEKVAELVIDVVHHFRPILSKAREEGPSPARARRAMGRAQAKSDSRELIDGRYERLKPIGSGGIGTVYLARQVLLDREVALKEIRELFGFFTEPQRQEIVKRFDEEVRKGARLSHPNIATIIDGNTTSDYPYVVSDYVSGGTLMRIVKYAESIPPDLAVKVFLQILHALRHAHQKGVVHRGLKPDNILFDSTGNVQITDFGMSRVVERDQAVIQHVYVGMGSVAYMAPELFNDPTAVGPQTDLYALGIILYEMLARKLPGRRSPMPTKLHAKLPKVIDDIFDRLTQDDRKDRYPSVDEVLEDFHKADASKDFIEPRGAMLFLENPLTSLQVKEPTEEAAAEEEEEEKKKKKRKEEKPAPEPALEPAPKDQAAPKAQVAPKAQAPSQAEAPKRPKKEEAPPAPEPLDPAPPPEAAAEAGDGEAQEAEGEDQEPGGEKRRRRSRRPYSFQQRMKERDK
jgi:serine/threonine-protein kinase